MDLLSMRGHVLLLAFFSLPLCLPVGIPVVSTLLGLLLIVVAFFLVLNQRPWLPDRLRATVIPFESIEKMVQLAVPRAEWVESKLKHRMPWLSEKGLTIRIHALAMLLLAFVASVPMVTNFPAAFPILMLSLGLLKRDGVFILAAYGGMVLATVFYAGLTLLGAEGVRRLIGAAQ